MGGVEWGGGKRVCEDSEGTLKNWKPLCWKLEEGGGGDSGKRQATARSWEVLWLNLISILGGRSY